MTNGYGTQIAQGKAATMETTMTIEKEMTMEDSFLYLKNERILRVNLSILQLFRVNLPSIIIFEVKN